MKQKPTELKGETDSTTIKVDFKTPLIVTDETTKHKINKETKDLTRLYIN